MYKILGFQEIHQYVFFHQYVLITNILCVYTHNKTCQFSHLVLGYRLIPILSIHFNIVPATLIFGHYCFFIPLILHSFSCFFVISQPINIQASQKANCPYQYLEFLGIYLKRSSHRSEMTYLFNVALLVIEKNWK